MNAHSMIQVGNDIWTTYMGTGSVQRLKQGNKAYTQRKRKMKLVAHIISYWEVSH